jgi:hypothetical protein
MTMTPEQVRDRLRSYAKDADLYASKTGESLELTTADELADAIDAHIAGMGEPVAWLTEDGRVISAKQKNAAIRDGGASASSVAPFRLPAYTAPPIDLAAVREVIAELRQASSDTDCALHQFCGAKADELEAAIKGGA